MSDEAGMEPKAVEASATNDRVPDDAFISPDEPIVRDSFRDALISPDEPIELDDDGVVVGMDGSPDHEPVGFGIHLEPSQMAVVLEHIAAGLREHGTSGLVVRSGTPHFESVLKAYIAGYFSTDS